MNIRTDEDLMLSLQSQAPGTRRSEDESIIHYSRHSSDFTPEWTQLGTVSRSNISPRRLSKALAMHFTHLH